MRAAGIFIALAAAGCSQKDADLKLCETFIKGGIIAPASYITATVDRYDEPITRAELRAIGVTPPEGGNLALRKVIVSYDNQNRFGAMLREYAICTFVLRDGKLGPQKELDRQLMLSANARDMYLLRRSVGQDDTPYHQPEYPCCLGLAWE